VWAAGVDSIAAAAAAAQLVVCINFGLTVGRSGILALSELQCFGFFVNRSIMRCNVWLM